MQPALHECFSAYSPGRSSRVSSAGTEPCKEPGDTNMGKKHKRENVQSLQRLLSAHHSHHCLARLQRRRKMHFKRRIPLKGRQEVGAER